MISSYTQWDGTEKSLRQIVLGRLTVTYERCTKKGAIFGRFGGGWNWELGFVAGGRTVIVNCLVFSVRFHVEAKEEHKE